MLLKRSGFTLVEIMIVVAILGLIASIAIPNLMRARLNASEGAMRKDMRSFSTANEGYRAAQNPPAFSPDIATLTTTAPPYLDTTWTTPPKHGFDLTYAVAAAPAGSYSLLADPNVAGSSALNTYCVDQTGVVVSSTQDGTANVPTADATGCSGGVPIN